MARPSNNCRQTAVRSSSPNSGSWHPLWEWLGQPAMSLPFLLGCLMLTLALGLARLPYRQPVDQTLAHG